jgi:hypothetical protein
MLLLCDLVKHPDWVACPQATENSMFKLRLMLESNMCQGLVAIRALKVPHASSTCHETSDLGSTRSRKALI